MLNLTAGWVCIFGIISIQPILNISILELNHRMVNEYLNLVFRYDGHHHHRSITMDIFSAIRFRFAIFDFKCLTQDLNWHCLFLVSWYTFNTLERKKKQNPFRISEFIFIFYFCRVEMFFFFFISMQNHIGFH